MLAPIGRRGRRPRCGRRRRRPYGDSGKNVSRISPVLRLPHAPTDAVVDLQDPQHPHRALPVVGDDLAPGRRRGRRRNDGDIVWPGAVRAIWLRLRQRAQQQHQRACQQSQRPALPTPRAASNRAASTLGWGLARRPADGWLSGTWR